MLERTQDFKSEDLILSLEFATYQLCDMYKTFNFSKSKFLSLESGDNNPASSQG